MRRVLPLIVALVIAIAGGAGAQISTGGGSPVYHGLLDILGARGRIDIDTGNASVKVHRWRFIPAPNSNGIFPAEEPVRIALDDNTLFLPAGSLKASRHGRVFRYKAPRDAGPQAVRSLEIRVVKDGTYRVKYTLTGLNLSKLLFGFPTCVPTAVIIGDDDGFAGAWLNRQSFESPRLAIPRSCEITNDWPWLQ